MAVELRIAGNVRGVGCVPYRRYDRCTWSSQVSLDVERTSSSALDISLRARSSRREESMVPGATGAKEGAR
eukprot:6320871-Prymnesium_polylepis.1